MLKNGEIMKNKKIFWSIYTPLSLLALPCVESFFLFCGWWLSFAFVLIVSHLLQLHIAILGLLFLGSLVLLSRSIKRKSLVAIFVFILSIMIVAKIFQLGIIDLLPHAFDLPLSLPWPFHGKD